MIRVGGGVTVVATLLLAGLLLLCLHDIRIDGPLRVKEGSQGWLLIEKLPRIPPRRLGDVIACGVDGKCRVYAVIDFPAGFEAAPLSGKPVTLLHREFTLPGLERFGVTARTWRAGENEVLKEASWPVYAAYAAVSSLPLLAWAVVAGLALAWRVPRAT